MGLFSRTDADPATDPGASVEDRWDATRNAALKARAKSIRRARAAAQRGEFVIPAAALAEAPGEDVPDWFTRREGGRTRAGPPVTRDGRPLVVTPDGRHTLADQSPVATGTTTTTFENGIGERPLEVVDGKLGDKPGERSFVITAAEQYARQHGLSLAEARAALGDGFADDDEDLS